MYDIGVSILSVLSICSLGIFVIMAFGKLQIKAKQCFVLLVPMVLLAASLAYGFDYIQNANNDLSRYLRDVGYIQQGGFWAQLYAAESHTIVFRTILWLTSFLNDYHWLPFIVNLFEYGLYAYILSSVAEKNRFTGLEIIVCLIFKISLMPPIMSFAAFKNTLAIDFFTLFIYFRYIRKDERQRVWLLAIASVLTHSTSIIPLITLLIASKWRGKVPVIVLAIIPFALKGLETILDMLPFTITQRYAYKLALYATHPTVFDTYKSFIILSFFVFLVIFYGYSLYVMPKDSEDYVLCQYMFLQMIMMLGFSITFPELFLRLNYVVSITYPFFYAINRNSVHSKPSITSRIAIGAVPMLSLFAFFITGGGWLNQIYWYKLF